MSVLSVICVILSAAVWPGVDGVLAVVAAAPAVDAVATPPYALRQPQPPSASGVGAIR
jgi:hypothetical protein